MTKAMEVVFIRRINYCLKNLHSMKFLAMKKMYLLTSTLFVFCFVQDIFAQQIKLNPYKYETTKIVVCKNGAVVSANALASQVGVNILKEGGNAIDASIATQLALAVVFPAAGNIGGGGFIKLNTSIPIFVKSTPWKKGDILIQKDLANTLKRIRDNGAKGFYEGETAKLIVCLLYTSPSPRDGLLSRMPSSA